MLTMVATPTTAATANEAHVKLCLEPGASCQKIADSLNLKSSLLYGWLKVYRDK
jgi:transposase-like protein